MDLARRYCADSGLSTNLAMHVAAALSAGVSEDFSRLPSEEREIAEKCYQDADALMLWVWDVWRLYSPSEDAQKRREGALMYAPPTFVPSDERLAIHALIEPLARAGTSDAPDSGVWDSVREVSPSCAAHWQVLNDFRARVVVRGDELSEYTARVAREAAGRWVNPEEWLSGIEASPHGPVTLLDIQNGCWWLGQEEQRAEITALREENAALKRLAAPGDVTWSGPFVEAQFRRTVPANYLKHLQSPQGDSFPLTGDDETSAVLEQMAENVSLRSLFHDMAEFQAIQAMLKLFQRDSDGDRFTTGQQQVPFSAFCRSVGCDPRDTKACSALFDAVRRLNGRRLHMALKLPKTVTDAKGRERTAYEVIARDVAPFSVMFRWSATDDKRRSLSEAEAARTVKRYRELGEHEKWGSAPLPTSIVVTIHDMMRYTGSRLVVSGDLTERLKRGSQQVRGETRGAQVLDALVFMTATQRTQPQSGNAYITRSEIFTAHYGGEEQLAKLRARGKFKTKVEIPYLTSLDALEAAGVLTVIERGRVNARTGEVQDVVRLSSDVVRPASDSAQLSMEAGETDTTRPKRRRQPTRRKT